MDLTAVGKLLARIASDLLFPPTKRVRRVRRLSLADVRSLPQITTKPHEYGRAVYSYKSQLVRDIVQAAKYDGSQRAAQIMGALLYDHLLTICAQERVITDTVTLVPIPLSQTRYQQRGFNQCQRIVTTICQQAGQDDFVQQNALVKTHTTPAQTSLPKTKRKSNLRGCFQLSEKADITDNTVILIDDVTTTGSTFREARSEIQAGDPETVLAVAFAH